MLLESLILILLRLIITKDHTNSITLEMILGQIKTQYILEKTAMIKKQSKFQKRWEKLSDILSIES